MASTLRDHFRKGAEHWNEFIETYDGETIDFEAGEFRKDPLDLSGYEFPLPTSFDGCVFKGDVRIIGAMFESWVSFGNATFEKSLVIEHSQFEGEADFESCRCEKSLHISECKFAYRAKFDDLDVLERFYLSDSTFEGDVDLSELGAYGGFILSDCTFAREVTFSGQFEREALLLGNKFDGFVYFQLAHFRAPAILRGNIFKHRPLIDKIRLSYVPIMPSDKLRAAPTLVFGYHRFLQRLARLNQRCAGIVAVFLAVAKAEDGYPSLRQFRLFAQEHDDRRLALEIYALEQKSRRLWYDHPLSSSFILGLLFQIFSDFGRSIVRPFVALCILLVISVALFCSIASPTSCSSLDVFKYSFLLSANNTAPFLSWQKQTLLSAAELCLFPRGGPVIYGVISIVQVTLSVSSIFLIGLAIRNSFKMQS